MNKNRIIKAILAFGILALTLPNQAAFAAAYISISNVGGNNVSISISGAAAGQPIDLVYTSPGSSLPTVITNIGTAYGGYYNGNLNLNDYGITNGSQIYVRVGGDQSNAITVNYGGYLGGCTYNCGSPYGLSLSQTNVNLTVGQSATVTAYNYSVSLYVSSNSNPNVVSASVSGNQINLYGLANGSSTVSVCANGNSACASIYVTVSGSVLGANTNLWFSPSSPTMYVGQSLAVSINSSAYSTYYPYASNAYYVSSNSNSSVVSASVSGTVLNLYANQNGSSSITVCHSSLGFCGTVYVTVGGDSIVGGITFSENNFTMAAGQSKQVTVGQAIYPAPVFYISSNSNPSAVSAYISGNTISLYAQNSGSATIVVCRNSGACANLYVTVSGSSSGGSISFSENYISLNVGQSRYVNVYNNSGSVSSYYIASNSNPSAASASVSGSQINIYGQNPGSATLSVCLLTSSSVCGTLSLTVGGGFSTISFGQNNPNLSLSQSMTVGIYGGTGSGGYYLSSNSNPDAVTASVSGNYLYLSGRNYGSTTLIVCQSGLSSCGTLYVTVGGGSYGGSLSLSQTNLSLSPYQSAAVNIFGSGNYYISSNSNPSAASATLSGSTLNVYAYVSGSASISVCQNYNSQCATLQVSVSGFPGGDIRIVNTTLPAMTIGQYYSNQLNVSGGTPPYTFLVNSGGMPAGLSLSTYGVLSGVPQYAYTTNFSVRVTDSQGRSGVTPFTIYGSGSGAGSGGVLGASTYKNGQLIKEGGTIYIVYRNMKSGFATFTAFIGFGFKLSNVIDVGNSGLANSGYIISTSNTSHPWGTWIKSGQTVYFMHETGLIPVPDWDTFINNGGQADFIVKANLRDFQLPILSVMVFDDARLR